MEPTKKTLMDRIAEANLFAVKCAHNDDHTCIVVWSSGAEEQLEAAYGPELEAAYKKGWNDGWKANEDSTGYH